MIKLFKKIECVIKINGLIVKRVKSTYVVLMIPKYVGRRFWAESDGASQINSTPFVHVQIWSSEDGGRRNWN